MTAIFFTGAYRDQPPRNNPRAVLEFEIARLKVLLLSDASDSELRERIAELEAELAAFDHKGGAP